MTKTCLQFHEDPHFQSVICEMRVNLGIIDWGEHMGREATSLQNYSRATNPNSQSLK